MNKKSNQTEEIIIKLIDSHQSYFGNIKNIFKKITNGAN